jgi:hypothetical protein
VSGVSQPQSRAGLGVETFSTLACAPDKYAAAFHHERLLNTGTDAITAEQRESSKALRGRVLEASPKGKESARSAAPQGCQQAHPHPSDDSETPRQASADCYRGLSIKNMTASATGTCRGTRQKGQAKGRVEPRGPGHCAGSFLNLPVHQSAGSRVSGNSAGPAWASLVPDCRCCGTVRKKEKSERDHDCGCGFAATRDQAAALRCWSMV